jgi:peroxiredoxin Q/BCP
MLQQGSPAPDFCAVDQSGVERRLGDYAGKTLVLWFYPKADTPG